MAAPTNPNRRSDVAAALKKAKPRDMLTLAALALIWGVSKARFVTVMQTISGMPEPVPQGNAHLYPAQRALKAMLAHETRNDEAARRREETQAAILGSIRKQRAAPVDGSGMPARDLAILSRLAAEAEERERAQREYISAAEVAATAGEVFALISEFMAELPNAVDPNGLLDPKLRDIIATNGNDALVRFHGAMKKLLAADAVAESDRSETRGARKPRARRTRH